MSIDWKELADAVLTARKENVPEYLRYRIEKVFMPASVVATVDAALERATARATAAEARSVPVETYQRDIALRDEAYAQLEAENAKLRTFAEAFARQPCSCGVMQGAITCAPCQARAALETDNG